MFLQTEPDGIITFENNTPFRVNITIGLMARELDPIDPWASLSVPNVYSETEIYYLGFDIPLLSFDKNYDLLNIRPAGISGHFQIDGSNKNQIIIINTPPAFDLYNSYVVITNNSRIGGIYLSENQASRLTCIHDHHKNNINQNETEVFSIKPERSKTLFVSGPVNIALPALNYNPAFVYYFSYNGSAVTLTDARPLHRIGEDAWAVTINNAAGPLPLVAADGEIHLFASTGSSVIRNVYDSSGNVLRSVQNGDAFSITYAGKAADGFFIAGYEKLPNGNYRPVARIHNMDGSTRNILEGSSEYYTARFFTAAQKDNTAWLLAGDGEKTGAYGNTAYARMVRIENDELIAVWELSPDIKCGDIKSAVYDNTRDCWFVTGENYDTMQNQIAGSYIARISGDGTIQRIDNPFRNMSFYKILIDNNGICYLAGEEYIGNETFAVIVKYNINESSFQRIITQTLSHSYYHDALLDTANNRIILCGVMKAADRTGRRGIPFIDAVNIQTGTQLWREELSNPEITGTGAVLVTAIVPAPDYGFALTLSGIGPTGYYEEPYMLVRVNSQGKYLKEIRQ